MRRIIPVLMVLAFPALLSAQQSGWQLHVMGGLFTPADIEVQNIYGSAGTVQLALAVPVGSHHRVRFLGRFVSQKGDPYYILPDFYAGKAASLRWLNTGILFEFHSRYETNPRIYVGAGLQYSFGWEHIVGIGTNRGDGLGLLTAFQVQFRLAERLHLIFEPSLALNQLVFRPGKNRYRFNLSGAYYLFGFVYRLNSRSN